MKVGFGKTDITPPLGALLCGQLHEKRATYVESPLHATAMCIEDGNNVILLVSCDLVFVTAETAGEVKALVAGRLPIKQDHVFISATHTHSGPATVPIFGMGAEGEYLAGLPARIASAIEQAYNNRLPCTLKACAGRAEDLCFNRRFVMADGKAHTHPLKCDPDIIEAEGPSDPQVGVVVALGDDGAVLGGILNFACHGTVLDRYDTGISADYPGYVCRSMDALYPQPTTWLFLNGACGNLCQVDIFNPDRNEVGPEWAGHMGESIARAASQAIDGEACSGVDSLTAATAVIQAPFRKIPDSVVEEARRHLDEVGEVGEPPNVSNYGAERADARGEKVALEEVFASPFWERFRAREILTLKEEAARTPMVDVPLGVIKGADFALVTVPGELFVEWGLLIKEQSPFTYTFVAELTNGDVGYIPTDKAFSRKGGYETEYVTSTRLAEGAGEIISAKILDMLRE